MSGTVNELASQTFSGIRYFSLKNNQGIEIQATNYGGIITSIHTPDRMGRPADIVLGFHSMQDYWNAVDKPYFGALIGRYGNRIARGRFTLDGATHQLAVNNNNLNHLHGGICGFDKVLWNAEVASDAEGSFLKLMYRSQDLEEKYPGNLDVTVHYRLNDQNEFHVEYWASTDQATPINLTQHTYFNLAGEGSGDVLGHVVQLNASSFTPVDVGMIPTGEISTVKNTPFDFLSPKTIGRDLQGEHEQLRLADGYDHNFILDPANKEGGVTRVGVVSEPVSGRVLEVRTTEPAVQFYTGNFLDGRLVGKSGKRYVKRGGFCLETQHYPDSPNQPHFPSTILRPGETYSSKTVFLFSTSGS